MWVNGALVERRDSRPEIENRTYGSYKATVDLYFKPSFGDIRLADLRPMHIEIALAKWATSPRKTRKKGCCLKQHSSICGWPLNARYCGECLPSTPPTPCSCRMPRRF